MEKLLLRPNYFSEYIGQKENMANLVVYVNAAKKRMQLLDHIIIHGASGCGKTTLAYIIANELETKLICTNGVNLQKISDVISVMTNLEDGTILFIDEIHRIPKNIEEIIYSVMEDFRLDLVYGVGIEKQTINIDINPFTLVGATTMFGKLSEPLRNRFPINFHMQEYTKDDMLKIINRTSNIIDIKLDLDVQEELVNVTRLTPRITNNLLKRIRDFATEFEIDVVDLKKYYVIIKKLGIQKNGLYNSEIKALKIINENGPIGSEAVAKIIGIDKITYENTIEAYLVKNGYIKLTKQGRIVSVETIKILEETSGN